MTSRDRKLILILVPVATFALYWMALLNPALERRAALDKPLAQAQTDRDQAVNQATQLAEAKNRYDSDYAEMVELSRAIPQSTRVSDLMRDLNAAAKGTDIKFKSITVGSAAGGDEEGQGAPDPAQTAQVDGLEAVPVSLTFSGHFFGLAGLFHRVQNFVTLADGKLQVHGRLIKIESFSLQSGSFPEITASIGATVYAAPAAQGSTGGATSAGPPGAERGDGGLKPVNNFSTATAVP